MPVQAALCSHLTNPINAFRFAGKDAKSAPTWKPKALPLDEERERPCLTSFSVQSHASSSSASLTLRFIL